MSLSCVFRGQSGCRVEMGGGKVTGQAFREFANGSLRSNRGEVEFPRGLPISPQSFVTARMDLLAAWAFPQTNQRYFDSGSTGLQQNSAPCWLDGDYAGSRKRSETSPAEWSTDARCERSEAGRIRGGGEGSSGRRIHKNVEATARRPAHRRTGTAHDRASTYRPFYCPAYP